MKLYVVDIEFSLILGFHVNKAIIHYSFQTLTKILKYKLIIEEEILVQNSTLTEHKETF
jgi:hypothetical protein